MFCYIGCPILSNEFLLMKSQISLEHFREKCFRQKFGDFEGDIRWYYWFDFE